MTETIIRGPMLRMGTLFGGSPEPFDGPGLAYQGDGIPDARYSPVNLTGMMKGRFPGYLDNVQVCVVDQIPSAYSTTSIANTQLGTSTSLTLVSTCPGGTVVNTKFSSQCVCVVPFIPTSTTQFPPSGSPINVLSLDFGFTVGTTVAGSGTVTGVPDATILTVGRWYCIGGTITRVTAISGSTLTVSPTIPVSITNAPIGNANFAGDYPANAIATAINPYHVAGTAALFDPCEAVTRGVSVTAQAGATATSCLIKGYDIYGYAMSESITIVAGSTAYGKKAFGYIASATLNSGDVSHTYSVGTSDVYGIHLRSDKWEFLDMFWNGSCLTSNSGWTAAVTTTASSITGDVRGTIQTSAIGGGSGYGATASNGSVRLTIFESIPLFNLTQTTPINTVPMFGVAQA